MARDEQADALETAREVIAAFVKEQPEAWGAPSEDENYYGFEWHFADGTQFWLSIDPECGFQVLWRVKGKKAKVFSVRQNGEING